MSHAIGVAGNGINKFTKSKLNYLALVDSSADTTHFVSSMMIGFGNDYFVGWNAYVVWDAGGATGAPQAEQVAVTDYVSSTGTFTLGTATTQLAAGDYISLIHPAINKQVDDALNTAVPASPTTGSLNDILSKASGGNTFDKATDSLEAIGEDTDALLTANPAIMATGTLTTSSTTVPADTGRAEADNYWNGCSLIPLTGTVALQPRKIASFANTGGVFTLETPFTAATGEVTYVIVPSNSGSTIQYKDIWCTAQLDNVTITTAGADKDFPDVVVAAQGSARGLPLGAVVTEAYLLMMFDLLDTSAAANYIKTASDDIRVMIDGQAWTDAPIAWTSVAGDWYTPASGMSSQVIIGAANVLLATYGVTTTGVGTYHVGSDETACTKAIESQGATLAFKNLRTGLRLYYRMP